MTNNNCNANDKQTFTVDGQVFKLNPAHGGAGADTGKNTFKLSKNKSYTLTLPDNLIATGISFAGYTNQSKGNGAISYVQLGSEKVDLSKSVFTATKSDKTVNTVATATFNNTTAGGSITISTVNTNQLCVTITITGTLKAATKPTLTINPSKIKVEAIPTQLTDTTNLTVTGEKLAANAVVNLTTNVAGLTLDPASVTADENGAFTQTVKAIYAPTEDAKASTGFIVASDGTNSDTTTVDYSAKLVASLQKVVSEETTWDFSKTGIEGGSYSDAVKEATLYSDLGATTSADFAADAITFLGPNSSAEVLENNTNCRVGKNQNVLGIKTSVDGTVAVTFSSTGGNTRSLRVNGTDTDFSTATDQITGTVAIKAGDVTITGNDYIKVYKIVFTPSQAETATISAAGYATYVTKGNVDFSNETTLKAYAAKYDATAQKITLTAVTSAPANTPLVLKGTAGDYTLTAATEAPAAVSNNDLQAASAAVTADGSQWILAQLNGGVGFAKCTPNTTIAAGKAYLVIPASATAKSFIGFDDDTTNGIASVISEEGRVKNSPIYNLAGQQVNKAYKGVVIVNGKKYIQK